MCKTAVKKHLLKFAAFAAALVLCLSFAGTGELLGAANPPKSELKVTCGGEEIEFESPVITRNGYAFFPLEELLLGMGAEYEWDKTTLTAIGRYNGNSIECKAGQAAYKVNGAKAKFLKDVIPFADSGKIYITVDSVAEALGFAVEWDGDANTINLVEITISFSQEKYAASKNTHITLEIIITPDWMKAEFSSSDENVAEVDEDGQVYAKNAGSAVITAVLPNGLSAECSVVVGVPVTRIDAAVSHDKYNVGETGKVIVTVYPEDAVDKSFTITSEKPGVVKVKPDGSFECLSAGESLITVTSANGITFAVRIYVGEIKVTKIEAVIDRSVLQKGESGTITIKISPEDATDKSFTITSKNPGVVKVQPDGSYECLSAGETVITVTSANGLTSTLTLYVSDAKADAVAAEVLRLVNIERANKGLVLLTVNSPNLTAAAQKRAVELTSLYTHDRPNGTKWSTVLDETGYTEWKRGSETIAAGYTTPQDLIVGLMASESNKSAILNPDRRYLGVGVAANSAGRLYWVLLYIE